MLTTHVYSRAVLFVAAATAVLQTPNNNNNTTSDMNKASNETTQITATPLGSHSKIPCLKKHCNCHLVNDTLFIECLHSDWEKGSPDIVDKGLSAQDAMESTTNDTLSPAQAATYDGTDLADLLLTTSVHRIYVTGFRGEELVLWDYLSKLNHNQGNSGMCKLYLRDSYFILHQYKREKEEDSSSLFGAAEVLLHNFTHLQMENIQVSFTDDHDNNNNDSDEILPTTLFPDLNSISVTKSNISVISVMLKHTLGEAANNMKFIDFSGNEMSTFYDLPLTGNVSLINFNISHNWFNSPSIGCNGQLLISLTTLDMSFNNIRSLSNAFCSRGVPKLQSLDLSGNFIEVLEKDSFDKLRWLTALNLHSNSIARLNFACFGCGLPSLRTLSMQNNSLINLDLEVFTPLRGLKQLNLSHNRIQRIERVKDDSNNSHCQSPYTTMLQLQNKQPFKDFPSFWPHLDIVDLSHNNISMITQKHFEELFKNVKYLLLANNNINYVPRYGIEHLHRLSSIDLSHNDIDWVDVGTFTNPHLQYIDLSHNKLKKIISMTFLYLPNLKRLNLSHNRLNYLYRASLYKTCKFGQLIELDLSHNRLAGDTVWKFMSTFREIKNANCQLFIQFQNNRMKYLLDSSSRAIFRHALIEGSPQLLRMWTHTNLTISNNPFHCDCQLNRDLNSIQKVYQDVFALTGNDYDLLKWQHLSCDKPDTLKGKSMLKASKFLQESCMGGGASYDASSYNHMKQKHVDCKKLPSISLQQIDSSGNPCQKGAHINQTSLATATTVTVLCTLLGLIAIICVLKKAGAIPILSRRGGRGGTWNKVHGGEEEDDENQNVVETIVLHYHKNDSSLVTGELVYFVQDCLPFHDILLQTTDNVGEAMIEQQQQPEGSISNLLIVSAALMEQIRSSVELRSYYEAIIEQSYVSVFLMMGDKNTLEMACPPFWAKVKYRSNAFFISGTDKLTKLQVVLKNTHSNDAGVNLY